LTGLASAIRIVAAPDSLKAWAVPATGEQRVMESARQTKWWPAGNGVMRRPLAPPPCRPNPTDPGDAADLSIPQGYQRIRKSFSRDFFASPFPLYSPSDQREGCSVRRLTEPLAKSTIKSAVCRPVAVNHNNCD